MPSQPVGRSSIEMTRRRRDRGPDSHSGRQLDTGGVSSPTYFMTPAEILCWLERTDKRVSVEL